MLHKPHFHVGFALVVLGLFIFGSVVFVFSKPPKYGEFIDTNSTNNSFHLRVPALMKQTYQGENTVQFEHQQADESAGVLSLVRAQSQYIPKEELKAIKPQILDQLRAKSGGYFTSFIEDSVQSGSSNTQYGNARKINSKFDDAWLMEFSYVEGNQTIHGVNVVAFGGASVYVLTIKAVEDIWQNNQSMWNQIVESFRR